LHRKAMLICGLWHGLVKIGTDQGWQNLIRPRTCEANGSTIINKQRLDLYLVEAGYYLTPRKALGPIMAGKVVVDGVVCTKPGTLIKGEPEIFIRGIELQYSSRGGYKLARAIQHFQLDLADRVVLDAGASTGGFTDCLLQAGAAKVYAVDVGYGQLRGKLAADSRVINMEKTNISDLTGADLPDVDFCTLDLSYLSLLKAVPVIRERCGVSEMICLVKPLYEGLPEKHKDNPITIRPILASLFENLLAEGHPVSDVVPSPVTGGKGAVEFLIYLNYLNYLNYEKMGTRSGELADRAMEQWRESPPVEEVSDLDTHGFSGLDTNGM
jgi:23S rRNA (cytidine1920-2'-O)/16S rRNA (cytidine1409-2'-O)-methyltransferase